MFGVHRNVELRTVTGRLSSPEDGGCTTLRSIWREAPGKGAGLESNPRIYLQLEAGDGLSVGRALSIWKARLRPLGWRVVPVGGAEALLSGAGAARGRAGAPSHAKITDFFRPSENPFAALRESPRKLRSKWCPKPGEFPLGFMSVNLNGVGGSKVQELRELALKLQIDIVAVQEHHLTDVTAIGQASGFSWFIFPAKRRDGAGGHHKGGTGFMVRNSMLPFLQAEPRGNDRMAMIWFKAPEGKRPLAVGSFYAPHVENRQERELFFEELARVSRVSERKGHDVVLMGDFNSATTTHPRLGSFPKFKGPECSEFVEVLESCSLSSAWVAAHGAEDSPPTCSNSFGGQNSLDHILVGDKIKDLVADAGVVEMGHLGSDHSPVFAHLSGFGERPEQAPYKTWNTQLLEDEAVQQRYFGMVECQLAEVIGGGGDWVTSRREEQGWIQVDPPASSEQIFDSLLKAIKSANEAILGTKCIRKGHSAKWFNEDVRRAVDERRKAYASFRAVRSQASRGIRCACSCLSPLAASCLCVCFCDEDCAREELRLAKIELRKARTVAKATVRDSKSECEKELIKELEEGSEKDFWRKVKWLNRNAAEPAVAVKDDEGTLRSKPEEVAEAFAVHYQRLGKGLGAEEKFDEGWKDYVDREVANFPEEATSSEAKEVTDCLGADFKRAEIEAVCATMKTGAPGKDGVAGLMAKVAAGYVGAWSNEARGKSRFVGMVVQMANAALREGKFPSQGKGGRIVNIFKDGDRSDRGNYRGITLLSVIGKLITRAIANRIQAQAEHRGWLADNQGGFRPGRRTEDNALVLLRALEKRREEGDCYVFFLDVKKAYDTVWRNGLLFKLHALGIRGRMYRLLADLYSGTKSSVVVGAGVESREFAIEEGVRQGDPLSCVLFNLFFNDIMEAMINAHSNGPKVDGVEVKGLMFADDVVSMATSRRGLASVLEAIGSHSFKWRWAPNIAKSMFMKVKAKCKGDRRAELGNAVPLTLNGKPVSECDEYKYLGIVFENTLNWEKHVRRIRAKARSRAGQWWTWIGRHRLKRSTKLKLYKSLVRPVLEYGSAVWSTDSKQASLLESVQNECLRQALPCDTSVPVALIRAELGISPLANRRDKLLLRYWLAMKHQRADRLAVKAFNWNLKCKRCSKCTSCTRKKQSNGQARAVECPKCAGCKCARMRRTLAVKEFQKLGMSHEEYEKALDPGAEPEERKEARRSFLEELEAAACRRDIAEARLEVRGMVSARDTQVAAGLARKEDWRCGRWLGGASMGALIKFRARVGRLLTGFRFIESEKGRKASVPEACPMCGDSSVGEEAQKHFIVNCPFLRCEREVILGAGPFRRRWLEKDLYEVVLSDAFADPTITERDAHEQEEMVSGFLARCWAIRRKHLQGAAQASRPSRHSDTSLGANPLVRDFFRGLLARGQGVEREGGEELGAGPRNLGANSHTRPHAHATQQPFTSGAPVPFSAFGPASHVGPAGESPETTSCVGPGNGLRGGSGGLQTLRHRSPVSMSGAAAHGDIANA